MATINNLVENVIGRVERAEILDGPANAIADVVGKLLPPGPVKNLLSGTGTGHPAHPIIVLLPLGSWASAFFLDIAGNSDGTSGDAAAQRLLVLGNLSALPTAMTGLSDWADTQGAERRVGLVHAGLNVAALGLFTASVAARSAGARRLGFLTTAIGMATVGASGWLGGHLAYARGVGTDTTAFEVAPSDWTDVADVDDVTEKPVCVDIGGVAVLLVRHAGEVRALSDRCSHRGGPLHEGEIENGCVVCPWHGSRFRLTDGVVDRGPATRPQRAFEVRTVGSRIQVRPAPDPGSLRNEPVTGAAAGPSTALP
ncbi:Rieske 2Fe-2S domain-containing protein [Arthrobacter sp. JZ12]|uniref:Rieske 2Fe-2S domain-containing protein n=1 Tax=Arthrobacter sp. JZ12 TaxID=2654190 RepID=UPI002B49D0B5|nr:Rieske 2Fe-2S domain-containing protein [Arthrobacter sp. JZ12]WRH24090.1 Rieske 2Fe-2S domain-containing protein [Arthrobacter sp. JZ12]